MTALHRHFAIILNKSLVNRRRQTRLGLKPKSVSFASHKMHARLLTTIVASSFAIHRLHRQAYAKERTVPELKTLCSYVEKGNLRALQKIEYLCEIKSTEECFTLAEYAVEWNRPEILQWLLDNGLLYVTELLLNALLFLRSILRVAQ